MQRCTVRIRQFASLLLVVFFSSCFHHFYKTNTQSEVIRTELEELVVQKKYFILHTQDSILGLANPVIETDSLKAGYEMLPDIHNKNLNPKTDRSNRLSKKNSKNILSEVHIYTPVRFDTISASGHIPYSSIRRIDVYGFDKDATSSSTVVSIIGILVGVVLLIIIYAATSGQYVP